MGEGKTEEGRRKESRMEERAEENEEGKQQGKRKEKKERKQVGSKVGKRREEGGRMGRGERTGALGLEGGKREPSGSGSVSRAGLGWASTDGRGVDAAGVGPNVRKEVSTWGPSSRDILAPVIPAGVQNKH